MATWIRRVIGAVAALLLAGFLAQLEHVASALLVSVLLVLVLMSLVVPQTTLVIRMGGAAALVAAAAYGALAPWLICGWGPPYDDAICPLDQGLRCELQQRRAKWGLAALAAAGVVAGWGVLQHWAKQLYRTFAAAAALRKMFHDLKDENKQK